MSESRREMERGDSDGCWASLGVMKFDLDLCEQSLTALLAVLWVRWRDLEQTETALSSSRAGPGAARRANEAGVRPGCYTFKSCLWLFSLRSFQWGFSFSLQRKNLKTQQALSKQKHHCQRGLMAQRAGNTQFVLVVTHGTAANQTADFTQTSTWRKHLRDRQVILSDKRCCLSPPHLSVSLLTCVFLFSALSLCSPVFLSPQSSNCTCPSL